MPVLKVNMICEKCGKHYTRSKSRMNDHSLCRSCHMKITYANNPKLGKNASEKRKKTCMEIYDVENVAQSKVCQEKEKKTRLERYGYEKPFMNKDFQLEVQKKAHTIEAELKRVNTSLEKTGETHHMKNKDIAKKLSITYKERTGYDNPMFNPEVKQAIVDTYGKIGSLSGYIYNDIHFDSSWELAFYIWLVDNKKQFIYHPPFSIDYIGSDENSHKYCPDFLVEGKFYEIKGTQFFDENGDPFNMYTKQFWWEKYNLIKDNNIIILKKEDIQIYLKYVSEKYGKHYLKDKKKKNIVKEK
jgi:hypothetical protein